MLYELHSGVGHYKSVDYDMSKKNEGGVTVLTREQLIARAEKASKDLLGISYRKAFTLLRKGKLHGTLANAVLQPMMDMLYDTWWKKPWKRWHALDAAALKKNRKP